MKGTKFLLLVLAFLVFTGCWNYVEVNDLAIVLGFAVDTGVDEGFALTAEAVRIEGGRDSQFKQHLIESLGESIFDGVRNMVLCSGLRLYWPHAIATVVSQEQATKGIMPILDWAMRDAEVRGDMWILISEGDAKDVFMVNPGINDFVAQMLAAVMGSHLAIPKFIPKELWQFKQELTAAGISPTLPLIRLTDNGKKVEVWGTAVFRQDKMVGYLAGPESQALSYVLNLDAQGLVIKDVQSQGEQAKVSYEVFSKKTSYTPMNENGRLVMNVEIQLEVAIAASGGLSIDILNADLRQPLEKELSKHVETQVSNLVRRVQQEFRSDIFGFGSEIRRQLPNLWREKESNWPQEFSTLEVHFLVESVIRASGFLSETVTVRD